MFSTLNLVVNVQLLGKVGNMSLICCNITFTQFLLPCSSLHLFLLLILRHFSLISC